MNKLSCSVEERFVDPLFDAFEGGDFVLSSYRDVEKPLAEMQVFFEDASRAAEAEGLLAAALEAVGAAARIVRTEIPDEDWKLSYRKHFTTERVGRRLVIRPEWEPMPAEGTVVTIDPGLAFGTGRHETTRACLEYIDALAPSSPGGASFLDMGCGSGILSIAASALGYSPVAAFDIDREAVEATVRNAAANGAEVECFRHALGSGVSGARALPEADLVAANILGPLLVRFADEIAPCARRRLIVSGILTEIYDEVLAAYKARGFREESRKTIGEWTTGLLVRTGRLERSAALLGAGAMARLASARVAVVGLGGVGSWCAEALARTGVGSLVLVDDDTVAESNMNRQCPAAESTLGMRKADAMAARLADVAPGCRVEAVSARYAGPGLSLFGEGRLDAVADAIDSVDCKAALVAASLSAGVPVASSMGAALRRDPTRVRTSDFWKASGDGLARALRRRLRDAGLDGVRFPCVWSDEPPADCGAEKGSLMTVTAAFGMALAAAVLDCVCRPAALDLRPQKRV